MLFDYKVLGEQVEMPRRYVSDDAVDQSVVLAAVRQIRPAECSPRHRPGYPVVGLVHLQG